MKKLTTLLIAATLLFTCLPDRAKSLSPYSVSDSSSQNAGVTLKKDLNTQLKMNQMRAFTNMTTSDFEAKTGRKLNFLERFSFHLTQNRMKHMLNKSGRYDDFTAWEKISWFLKGLLLGPLAILLGYIFLKDENRELIKWIWFGSIGWVLIFAVFLLSILV